MILTILGVVKILEVAKTGAITMARMNGPGKDEDDILLEKMLEDEVTVTREIDDDDEPEDFSDIEEELGI